MKITQIGSNPKHPARCVISLGIGKKSFTNNLKRLEESLFRVGFDGDFLYWDEQEPEGCPAHFEAPFAFKTYCFNVAKRMGYSQILWIDSPCIALRSLSPIFDEITKYGYIFFNNNYDQSMGQWISDDALAKNCLSRDEAMTIPEMPCSVLGLDMTSELAVKFLDQWALIMGDGITARGTTTLIKDWDDYQAISWNRNNRISNDQRVKGHRHDQSAAGIVAHRLGMLPYSDYLKDIHYKAKPVKRNTIILHHREFNETITPLNDIYYKVFFKTPFIEKPRSYVRKLVRFAKGLIVNK
jgi:hypothetical protein